MSLRHLHRKNQSGIWLPIVTNPVNTTVNTAYTAIYTISGQVCSFYISWDIFPTGTDLAVSWRFTLPFPLNSSFIAQHVVGVAVVSVEGTAGTVNHFPSEGLGRVNLVSDPLNVALRNTMVLGSYLLPDR